MLITDTHVYFYGGDTVFSNWHSRPNMIKAIGGHTFNNSEQAFMWTKAKFFKDDEIADKILHEPDPRENKKLGRLVKNYNDIEWNKRRVAAMLSVNILKYMQNPDYMQELLKTGDRILVEASPYDTIWGVGLHYTDPLILDEKNWRGENLLGRVLMDIRRDYLS